MPIKTPKTCWRFWSIASTYDNDMPINKINITSSCGECGTEIETVSVKKDNMMLFTKEQAWCPKCQADRPQIRDVSGRLDSIKKEQQSYPKAVPAQPFSDGPSGSHTG